MKPKIVISGYELGIMDDITQPVANGFAFGAGIDISKEPGILQVSQRLDAMTESAATNNITDRIMWMVKYSVNGKVYGLSSGKRMYNYDKTEAGKWCLEFTDSQIGGGHGMIEFNGYLYWASNSYLGQYDGTTPDDNYKALTTDTKWHPMCIFGDYLAIGSGRYIEHLSAAGTLTATAVDLPVGYRISSLAVFNNKLYIGTWRGSNLYDQADAKLFSCTMTQMLEGTFEEVTSLKECGINAMVVWKNNLIIFAGITGNIYAYNGATLTYLKTIPKIDFNNGDWVYVNPGAVIEYNGNLLFGVSDSVGVADYSGLYMLDKSTLALTAPHILSTGNTTNVEITSLLLAGTNQFYVAYYDDAESSFAVDSINTGKRITSTAFYESQIYDIANEDNVSEINGIELIARPLATGNSVAIEYKKDNASSWSSWGTITSVNQGMPLMIAIGQAKTIQVRLEFTTNDSNNNSPSILNIKIY